VRIFDLGRPDAEPDFLGEAGALSHEGMVKSVVWVGEHTGVTAGEDGLIKWVVGRWFLHRGSLIEARWWDLRTRKLTTSITFPNAITSMELSPQTKRLVVTSGKTVAFIPVLPNGTGTHTLTLPYTPSSASIHPLLQDRFVTGNSGDEWVRVHGMDGEEREVLKGHHGPVHCVEFSPDGEMYASGSGRCTLIWCYLISNDFQCTEDGGSVSVLSALHTDFYRDDTVVADDTRSDVWIVGGTRVEIENVANHDIEHLHFFANSTDNNVPPEDMRIPGRRRYSYGGNCTVPPATSKSEWKKEQTNWGRNARARRLDTVPCCFYPNFNQASKMTCLDISMVGLGLLCIKQRLGRQLPYWNTAK
jgi:hypothetical protein